MSESSMPAGRVTLADLEGDPHRVLAQLRAAAPAVWVPVESGTMPAPTAAADPLDEPPGVRAGSCGLTVGPAPK